MSIFEPKDLNFETVKQIFHDCMPEEGKTKKVIPVILQQKFHGFKEDSDPILFDAEKIIQNAETIGYLIGQLYTLHRGDYYLKLSDTLKKYNGYLWSKEKIAPLFLLHLGIGSGNLTPPSAEELKCMINGNIEPTLSPKDPNFEQWYEKNKVKFIRKKGGQEPADD